MKKSLTLIFLLMIPIVSAQSTITLLGREFNIVIFIPLALIAFSLFILLILYTIEYYKKLTKIIKFKDIFTLIFSLIKFKKRKEIKEKKVDVKKRILLLQEKLLKLSIKDSLNEITSITKDFYKYHLNIKPTLTDVELKETLKDNQKDILEFSEKLSELKYSGKEITKENVKELYNNLNSLIKKHAPHISAEEKEKDVIRTRRKINLLKKQLATNFKNNIKGIKNTFSSIKNYLHKLNIKSKKQKIFLLIKRGKRLLEDNIPSARNFYIKALLSYYKLRLQEEREIYSKLEEFHNDLDKRGHVKKDLTELSKKIIHLKHSNQKEEGLKFFKQLKDYIKNEEKSNIKKLQKYSTALKEGEQKLITDIKGIEDYAVQKKKKPLLHKIKSIKIKHAFKLSKLIPPKKEVFKIPEVKLTPPPKPKIKLTKHLSKLLNEKNIIYNKLRNLEQETRQYQKETNVYQKQFFAPKKLYIQQKETPQIIKKYNPHKRLNKLSQEKELLTKKLISLR